MDRWIGLLGLMITSAVATAPVTGQPKKSAKPPVQQIVPPKTVYWLSAATTSGISAMGGKRRPRAR